jgi:hypothetical protein
MNEQVAFDMFFASICSMQFHPGAGTKEHRQMTPSECANIALQMVQIRRQVSSQLVHDEQ